MSHFLSFRIILNQWTKAWWVRTSGNMDSHSEIMTYPDEYEFFHIDCEWLEHRPVPDMKCLGNNKIEFNDAFREEILESFMRKYPVRPYLLRYFYQTFPECTNALTRHGYKFIGIDHWEELYLMPPVNYQAMVDAGQPRDYEVEFAMSKNLEMQNGTAVRLTKEEYDQILDAEMRTRYPGTRSYLPEPHQDDHNQLAPLLESLAIMQQGIQELSKSSGIALTTQTAINEQIAEYRRQIEEIKKQMAQIRPVSEIPAAGSQIIEMPPRVEPMPDIIRRNREGVDFLPPTPPKNS